MLEIFVREWGIYYVIAALCSLSVMVKMWEDMAYRKLLRAMDNMEQTEHAFLRQLKLKYKSYAKLGYRVHNTKAFVKSQLYRYRCWHINVERSRSVCGKLSLLCIMTACAGVALCVHFEMDYGSMLYHILAGSLAIAGIALLELVFGVDRKRAMIQVGLEDYLENVYANQLESRSRVKEEAKKEFMDKLPTPTQQQIAEQIAASMSAFATESTVENKMVGKQAEKLAKEKVIADVIEQFIP